MSIAIRSVLRTGGGGQPSGLPFTVNCDSFYAGKTIICTDGETELTATCPSSSPYDVQFNIPNSGTWTINGEGSTIRQNVTIPGSVVLRYAIPDGKTETPTDNIQTWLACAQLGESYTTLSQVLSDSTTLTALISDNNAVDYMVRSTTWATDICADETAMTLIGADDYCADTLLADSTWLAAICNSTYFESVLNVKVPVMTGDTTPSGEASKSGEYTAFNPAWHAFDGDSSTKASPATEVSTGWLQYVFESPMTIYKVGVQRGSAGSGVCGFNVAMSNDSTIWETLLSGSNPNDTAMHYYYDVNDDAYTTYRLNITSGWNNQWWEVAEIQFWGRAGYKNALSNITMNSDEYECTEAMFWIIDNTWHLRAKFNKLVTNGAIRMSADLSDWLTGIASYSGFVAKTSGYNPAAFSSSFSNNVLTVGIDTNSGVASKPQNVDIEFYGTV